MAAALTAVEGAVEYPTRVDAYATEPHFADHIAPVWAALPDELRGHFFVERTILPHARRLDDRVEGRRTSLLHGRTEPLLVASMGDLRRVGRRPAIFMEHGAGQTYQGGHASYAGGPLRERVALFLNPSDRVAAINRAAWPRAAQAVVGCPKLDPWHKRRALEERLGEPGLAFPRHDPPTVAISWHFDCHVAPETRGAFAYYAPALEQLANAGWRILGHGHPRLWRAGVLGKAYAAAGIEPVSDFARVLHEADLYAVDNSSTLFEFASTGRPVVVMNAPWFRRDVEHGLRFWSSADIGIQVDRPDDLVGAIARALEDPPEVRARREEIVGEVYANRDGTAAAAAARAIAEWAGGIGAT